AGRDQEAVTAEAQLARGGEGAALHVYAQRVRLQVAERARDGHTGGLDVLAVDVLDQRRLHLDARLRVEEGAAVGQDGAAGDDVEGLAAVGDDDQGRERAPLRLGVRGGRGLLGRDGREQERRRGRDE